MTRSDLVTPGFLLLKCSGSTRCGLIGSPPRSWGKPDSGNAGRNRLRFTPTLVGKTSPAGTPADRMAVHPHARGENTVTPAVIRPPNGSPPRSWGKPHNRLPAADLTRFTPTLVGKTRRTPAATPPPTVHPHARGENTLHGCPSQSYTGSPPRSWGKPHRSPPATAPSRFTPTLVGKTFAG